MKFDICIFFAISVEIFRVSLKSDKNNRCFTLRPMYILITSQSVHLRKRNVSDKSCRENQNAHFMLDNFFF